MNAETTNPGAAREAAHHHEAGLVSARFRAGMRPLAVGTGLCVALAAPLADLLLERHDLLERARVHATEVAARLAAADPNAALLSQAHGLGALVDAFRRSEAAAEVQQVDVLDEQGSSIYRAPSTPEQGWPLVWGRAPVALHGRPSGEVRVAVAEAEWLNRDLFLLGVFSALGLVLGLSLYLFPLRLFREEDLVQLFARRSIRATEEERVRVSRDLHDGIGQVLGAAAVGLVRLRARVGTSPELDETVRHVDAALDELRRVTHGLRPPSLDDLGVGPAVEALARDTERTGLSATLDIAALPRMDPEVEETCYRLAQEALANVVRHARAKSFRITLAIADAPDGLRRLVLEVSDDGRGFAAGSGMGIGLVGARERAAQVAGTLSVESAPGHGTRVRAELPVGAPAERNGTPLRGGGTRRPPGRA